ncbi:hypothetical protein [Rhizobium sp. SL86]|uniref:hypothetical protein n=1 Tax=Rhizobium sp. SL86 TaxID=2995148 RepID=UPI0022724445|nr:hypothetical protein [Rhizobium sp. SL86]MCY1667843.1 hypothetical protein [Rhizobium sp. SL86]
MFYPGEAFLQPVFGELAGCCSRFVLPGRAATSCIHRACRSGERVDDAALSLEKLAGARIARPPQVRHPIGAASDLAAASIAGPTTYRAPGVEIPAEREIATAGEWIKGEAKVDEHGRYAIARART